MGGNHCLPFADVPLAGSPNAGTESWRAAKHFSQCHVFAATMLFRLSCIQPCVCMITRWLVFFSGISKDGSCASWYCLICSNEKVFQRSQTSMGNIWYVFGLLPSADPLCLLTPSVCWHPPSADTLRLLTPSVCWHPPSADPSQWQNFQQIKLRFYVQNLHAFISLLIGTIFVTFVM